MRLLDTRTGHFVEFHDTANVRYAILSHTWDACGEQTYQDVRKLQECHPIQADGTSLTFDAPLPGVFNQDEPIPDFWADHRLSEKIRKACEIARSHGYRYLWIDSCCIDKTSSSELSEAINSMYTWYGRAATCYAFLVDVPQDDVPDSDQSAFRKSRWFRRGWTLQELIAPRRLLFLSRSWQILGSKTSMAALVEQITRIDRGVLVNRLLLDDMSVARRMSWAAERETTRVEDRAYSLLGIFDLNMPTLYGEGERAFRRLQEEILRRIPDHTLLALNEHSVLLNLPFEPGWIREDGAPDGTRFNAIDVPVQSLLGSSPSNFLYAGSVEIIPEHEYRNLLGLSETPSSDFSPSPYGIRSSFPRILIQHCHSASHSFGTPYNGDIFQWYFIFLRCHCSSELPRLGRHLLARVCRMKFGSLTSKVPEMCNGALLECDRPENATGPSEFTLFTFTAKQLEALRKWIEVQVIYLPHPDRASFTPSPLTTLSPQNPCLALALSTYSSVALQASGYDVAFHRSSQMDGRFQTHSLVLQRRGRILQVNIDELCGSPLRLLSAVAWSFTAANSQHHRFPLSTCTNPSPKDGVAYDFKPGDDYNWPTYPPSEGFPPITLSGVAGRYEGVIIRLDLEKASSADSAVSHYLHVDIEEVGDHYEAEHVRGHRVALRICEVLRGS